MAGIRWPPEETDHAHIRQGIDMDVASHYSDDERSVAADSWSVKSEYGSTLDGDDARQSDAVDALAAAYSRPSDYSSDKEEPDVEVEPSMLGLQSHWDSTYAEELANFHEHGDSGENWFGEEVMETMASWTARICSAVSAGLPGSPGNDLALAERGLNGLALSERGIGDGTPGGIHTPDLASWSVLDLGTGNGMLLQALANQGFTDLTGTDYSDGAVELAHAIAEREGITNITFLVDDVLDSKLERRFNLITDKGTLDAIGLHPDGVAHKVKYWRAVSRLLEPGGVLVVTSCNNTKNELVEEVNTYYQSVREDSAVGRDDKDMYSPSENFQHTAVEEGPFLEYIDHVRSYPTFRFGGVEGSRVCTVAFLFRAYSLV